MFYCTLVISTMTDSYCVLYRQSLDCMSQAVRYAVLAMKSRVADISSLSQEEVSDTCRYNTYGLVIDYTLKRSVYNVCFNKEAG